MFDNGLLTMETLIEISGGGREGESRVELIHRKVHLLRCETKERGGIIMPDERADSSWWYQILAVSDDCKYLAKDHVGSFVILTDNASYGNSWAVGKAERIVREEWLLQHTPFTVFTRERK